LSFRNQTNFNLGLLSLDLISPKLIGAQARLASWHQHTYRICVPWPSGPKHILTWVYFPSAWFIYNLLGLALLSFMEPTYIYVCIYTYVIYTHISMDMVSCRNGCLAAPVCHTLPVYCSRGETENERKANIFYFQAFQKEPKFLIVVEQNLDTSFWHHSTDKKKLMDYMDGIVDWP
jgi:hypothetical protein